MSHTAAAPSSFSLPGATPGGSPAASLLQPQGLRILVVEDNPINQRVAVILVSKLGFTADVAEDGSEALSKVRDHAYHLILMDCQMPVMDGFEATRAIRALKSPLAEVPIIALTANVLDGQREKCLAAGMDDYLSKPINKDILANALQKWVAKRHEPASPALVS